jgi:hypothetical protein
MYYRTFESKATIKCSASHWNVQHRALNVSLERSVCIETFKSSESHTLQTKNQS